MTGNGGKRRRRAEFLCLPLDVLASPAWPDLTGDDIKVLLVLASHSDASWTSYPGLNTIATEAKLYRRSVQRAVRRLVEFSLVNRSGGKAGRGHSHRYTIVTGGNGRTYADISTDGKVRDGADISTGIKGAEKAHKCSTKVRTGADRTEEQKNRRTEAHAAAVAGALPEVEAERIAANTAALLAAGVHGKVRAELAGLPGIDAHAIRAEDEKRREHGKGVGVLVENLRGRSEAYVAERADARARREAAAAVFRDWQQRYEVRRSTIDAVISAADPDRVAGLNRDALRTAFPSGNGAATMPTTADDWRARLWIFEQLTCETQSTR